MKQIFDTSVIFVIYIIYARSIYNIIGNIYEYDYECNYEHEYECDYEYDYEYKYELNTNTKII
jgi:hypothetical protein